MKRMYRCLVVLLLAAACLCVFAAADVDTSTGVGENPFGGFDSIVASGKLTDTVSWKLDKNGVLTVSGNGAMPDYETPWSDYLDDIQAVVINDGITAIGEYVFSECYGLSSVTLPDSLTTVGNDAFSYCYGLKTLTLGSGLTAIGDWAFYWCEALETLTLPESLTYIGNNAFGYCISLERVSIPAGVEHIGNMAFTGCFGLTGFEVAAENSCYSNDGDGILFNREKTVLVQVPCAMSGEYAIPKTVTQIAAYAFSQSGVTRVTVPASVATIDNTAFFSCYALTGFEVAMENPCYSNDSNGVLFDREQTVLLRAPQSLSGAYRIPASVTKVDECAFCDCMQLTAVSFPEAVTTIGMLAFSGCRNLTSVTIPDSVTEIGYDAFAFCEGLTAVHISDLSAWCGIQFENYRANPLATACNLYIQGQLATEIVIPSDVTVIGNYAFDNCSCLTSVTISDGVTTLGTSAFFGCSGLTSVTIPNSVTIIGDLAFDNCSSLTDITLPDSITVISKSMFYGCSSLTNITLPDSVTVIRNEAFRYCPSLVSVTIPASVTDIGELVFDGCDNLRHVVYGGSEEQWEAFGLDMDNAPALSGATIHYNTDNCVNVYKNCVMYELYCSVCDEKILTNSIESGSHSYRNGICEGCGAIDPDAFLILTQPETQAVNSGRNAVFTVAAQGEGLTYRWQYSTNGGKTWSNSSSATAGYNTQTLTVEGTLARDGFLYRCKISDASGNVLYSDAAMLTVEMPLFTFVSHPSAETVKLGNRAAFTVEAEGEIAAYQWQYQMVENGPWWNCTQYTMGYNTTELNVIAAEMRQGFLYRCRITDAAGNKYYSNTAELTVDIPASYAILSQPKTAYVMPGKTTTFHIDTQGEGLTYQWEYHKGVDKSGPEYYWIAMGSTTGCKTDTLTIAGVSGSINRDGWAYRCVVTDANGYIYTTDYAFLNVTTAQIASQPESVSAVVGTNAVFTVEMEGKVASYQWQYSNNGGKSWYNSSSATQGYNTDTLTVGATAARNGFLYRCVITDTDGNRIETDPVTLTVQ